MRPSQDSSGTRECQQSTKCDSGGVIAGNRLNDASERSALSHRAHLTRDAERRDPKVNAVQWSDFWRVADGARGRGRPSRCPNFASGDEDVRQHADKGRQGGVGRRSAALDRRRAEGPGLGRRRSGGSVPRRRGQVRPLASRGSRSSGRGTRVSVRPLPSSVRDSRSQCHWWRCGGRDTRADWKPVVRLRGHEATDELSLLALLSQALMAFTAEYEAHGRGPLLWAVNMAKAFDEPMPLAAVPSARGYNRERSLHHGASRLRDGVGRTGAPHARGRSH